MRCPTCCLPNVRALDEMWQLQCGHIFCKDCFSNQLFCLDPFCDEPTDLFYQKTTETQSQLISFEKQLKQASQVNSGETTDTATKGRCTPMLWPSHVPSDSKEDLYTLDCCKRSVCGEHAAKLVEMAMSVEKYDAEKLSTTCPECNPMLRDRLKAQSSHSSGGRVIAGRFGTVLFDALDLVDRQAAEDAYQSAQLQLYTANPTHRQSSTTPQRRVNRFDKDAKCDGFACESKGAWLVPNCGHRSCKSCLKAVIKVAEYHVLQPPFCPEEYCHSTLDDDAIKYAMASF